MILVVRGGKAGQTQLSPKVTIDRLAVVACAPIGRAPSYCEYASRCTQSTSILAGKCVERGGRPTQGPPTGETQDQEERLVEDPGGSIRPYFVWNRP
jgi:hypothetical protein